MNSSHRRIALAAALLLAVVLLFHGKVLFRADWTYPWDFRGYHLPLAVAYADAIAERELPLWEPYAYCGRPLLANPQAAVFYPGMLIAALPGRDGLLGRLEWLAAGHVLLAGWLTFLLARRLGLDEAAALVAAVIFALGGFFATQMQHLGAILGAPWLVLSWWSVLGPPRTRVVLLALAWTLAFFAGFVPFTVMTVASTVLFALWLAPTLAQARGSVTVFRAATVKERRVFIDLALAAVLAATMTCVQWGPTLELVSQSAAKYRTDWMEKGGGISPRELVKLVTPNYHLTTLALASLAFTRRNRALWGACACFFILMAGQFTPAGRWLFQGSPEFLQRTVYWYVFLAPALLSLALLAATGASRLKRWSWAAAIVVAVELIALGSRRPANTESVRDLPYVTATAVDGSEEAAQKLRQWAGDLRIDTAGDSLALMAGAPVLRWRAANGYDPLALEHLVRLRLEAARGERWGTYYEIEQPDSPALDWMSIRVVTSREQLVTQKLTEAGLIPGRWVYLNPGALLRYRAAGCVVKIVRESRNRIELDTWCQREALLETSEMHYSAWRAAIDGGPGNIELVRGAFRGVRIPPGHHQVVFRYSAWLVAVCGVVSLCGWTAWVWLWRKASRGSFN